MTPDPTPDPTNVPTIAPLADALNEETFGGKASALARALGAGLPVPPGFALSWEAVARVAAGDPVAVETLTRTWRAAAHDRVAVRSSAIGEDSAGASFAGQHLTVLNVTTEQALIEAVKSVHASAQTASALEYRRKMGVQGNPRIAVVVLKMIEAAVAGVLFTRNPMSGVSERVIESAWGLGEAVVAQLVTPDFFRVGNDGQILERRAGRKDLAIRFDPDGGTVETAVADAYMLRLSLDDQQLKDLHQLAQQCESAFPGEQDIEWAIAGGRVYLLQSRPITSAAPAQPFPAETHEELPVRRFAGLALAALLAPLNSTIIAVALPSISGTFGASPSLATRWLVTAYLVVSIVAQSPAGKLADLWGTSRILTLGRAAFGIGALLAAFSTTLPMLGAGRVLMALGGALSIPTVFAQLRNSVPRERRGRIFGIFGAIMGGAAALGPLVGGFLTSRYGWHSIFLVNIPVVVLSFLLEPPTRSERRPAQASRFDFPGSILLGVAVLMLVGAVERTDLVLAFGALAAIVAFVMRELRAGDPVLDMRLFQRSAFAAGSAIVALQNLAMYSMIFLLPFFLHTRGSAPSATGRMLILFTLAMVLLSPVGGRLSDAVGACAVAFSGALVATAGAVMFVETNLLIPSLILMGAGIGICTGPSQAAALSAVPAAQAGVASGALSTMRYVGGVAGSGIVGLIVATAMDRRMLIFPGVLLASAFVALALPGRQSKATAEAQRHAEISP